MPSIKEVFGLVALEGASCSVPSVIFEGNGCSDLIEHKINGSDSKNIKRYKAFELINLDRLHLNKYEGSISIKSRSVFL